MGVLNESGAGPHGFGIRSGRFCIKPEPGVGQRMHQRCNCGRGRRAYAGHHGLLGAAGSCIVGHHLAKKHAEEERARERAYEQQRCANPSPGSPTYGSGTPPAAYHISRPSIHPYNILNDLAIYY